jgi:hypothetical protein
MDEKIGSSSLIISLVSFRAIIIQNENEKNNGNSHQYGRQQIEKLSHSGLPQVIAVKTPECINQTPENGNGNCAVKQGEKFARFMIANDLASVHKKGKPCRACCQKICDEIASPDYVFTYGHL